jgi:hypothetical protein
VHASGAGAARAAISHKCLSCEQPRAPAGKTSGQTQEASSRACNTGARRRHPGGQKSLSGNMLQQTSFSVGSRTKRHFAKEKRQWAKRTLKPAHEINLPPGWQRISQRAQGPYMKPPGPLQTNAVGKQISAMSMCTKERHSILGCQLYDPRQTNYVSRHQLNDAS